MSVNQLFAEASYFSLFFTPVDRDPKVCPASAPICKVNFSNDKQYFD